MSVFPDLFFSMYTHARSWCNTRAVVLKSGCFDGASFFFVACRCFCLFVFCARHGSGGGEDEEMMSDFFFFLLHETEDAFLVELNQKNLGPKDYAAALLVEHGPRRPGPDRR